MPIDLANNLHVETRRSPLLQTKPMSNSATISETRDSEISQFEFSSRVFITGLLAFRGLRYNLRAAAVFVVVLSCCVFPKKQLAALTLQDVNQGIFYAVALALVMTILIDLCGTVVSHTVCVKRPGREFEFSGIVHRSIYAAGVIVGASVFGWLLWFIADDINLFHKA